MVEPRHKMQNHKTHSWPRFFFPLTVSFVKMIKTASTVEASTLLTITRAILTVKTKAPYLFIESIVFLAHNFL